MRNVSRGQSTGLPGLDKVLKGIIPGDNFVWQVNAVSDYAAFVKPFCDHAHETGREVVYFRFARHAPLLEEGPGVKVQNLHPEEGFEPFIAGIHGAIQVAGDNAYYVFDCLSDLAVDWFSDRMLGNIFMLTCPYLYDLGTLGYFALLANHHSFHATAPIAETTQVLIDVYKHKDKLYIHPIKAQQRFSPTIHMLHVWENDEFLPVMESTTISEILTIYPWSRLESSSFRLGPWSSAFLRAEEMLHAVERGEYDPAEVRELTYQLLRMLISRDERALSLAVKYLDLSDIVRIRTHMIGTGLVGGKAMGLLMAYGILRKADKRWNEVLEPPDVFFIGSDVFYTFLVQNGCWWVRQRQRDPNTYLEGAEDARRRILTGTFPDYINRQFTDMLDYFGQSPIVVRSSSVLEDNFGNSLVGKGQSVFCANQGPRHERLEDFKSAIRTIYASSMSKEALIYRARRGIIDREEQMAILVQRVSGCSDENYFFPHVSGVGFSYNPYVWSKYIDPKAGVLRLVFGLGTRAVAREDDDYTRIVALNAPKRRPEASFDEVREYSQKKVDVLDLAANRLVVAHFVDVARRSSRLPLELFASKDRELERIAAERKSPDVFPWVLTFEKLLDGTDFVRDMREILRTLQEAYDYPVDVEFAANFVDENRYKINIVQCRPLQVKGGGVISDPPTGIGRDDIVLESQGAVIGKSVVSYVDRFIYVVPSVFAELPNNERFLVARVIGRLTHLEEPGISKMTVLVGPGRWGTTTPSLGVPIAFSDISGVSALCEIEGMSENVIPDVSLGTHFFNELVESDILYIAMFPKQKHNYLSKEFFENSPNKLPLLLPDASKWSGAIKVIDASDLGDGKRIKMNANTLKQRLVCYFEKEK